MRSLIILVLIALFGGAGLYGAGSALPEEVAVHRGMFLQATPDQVVSLLPPSSWQKWWKFFTTVITKPVTAETPGQPFEAVTRYGNSIFFFQKPMDSSYHYVWVLQKPWLGLEGGIAVQVTQQNNQTFVKISEIVRIQSPYWRFLWYYILGKDHIPNKILEAMAEHLGEKNVKIEELVL